MQKYHDEPKQYKGYLKSALVRALCAEVHEAWLEDHRYLNMEYLKEQKKELRTAA